MRSCLVRWWSVTMAVFLAIGINIMSSAGASAQQRAVTWNDVHSGEQGEALRAMASLFEEKHPGIKVKLNITEHELAKTLIRMWFTADEPPDVIGWQQGDERFHYFTRKGLVKDVTELWESKGYDQYFSQRAKEALSLDGRIYGIPMNVSVCGFYYKKSLWEELGFTEPKTWDDFLNICGKFKAQGIAPISTGIRHEKWVTGAWFDYFNMRINGLSWYLKLLRLEESYTDPKVYKVMETWKDLVDKGYFIKDFGAYDRTESYMFVVKGDAGTFLGGNYEIYVFPEEEQAGVFQFPIINPSVGTYEQYYGDLWVITQRAPHPDEAEMLLDFLASEEAQELLYRLYPTGIPAHKQVPKELYMTPRIQKMLNWAEKADGTMNFYDRDTYPPMYDKGYDAFAEFMMTPENYKKILANLDNYRKRYVAEYK